jgi:hypothetical protein
MDQIEVGSFIYEQDGKGGWTFKSKETNPLDSKGTLKPQYKELPQFSVIYDIDTHMRGQMMNEIKTATKEILQILKP